MKKRPTTFKQPSALEPRRYSTAPSARPDIAQAVTDIRAAVATIARLAALDTLSEKGVKQ